MTDSAPDIIIVMMTYNHEWSIQETLDSLLAQTYKNFHLFIIDDASKDNTAEIINQYKKQFKNFTFIQNKENKGAVENYNYTFELVKKEVTKVDFFLWCAPDDTLSPTYLQKTREALLNTPGAVAAQTNYEMIYLHSGKRTFHELKSLNAKTYREARKVFLSYGSAETKTHYNGVIHGLIRFSEIDKIFPQDRKLIWATASAEISLLIAMLLRGSIEIVPEILYHRKKAGTFENSYPSDEYSLKVRKIFYRGLVSLRCLPWFIRINDKNRLSTATLILLWLKLFFFYIYLSLYRRAKLMLHSQ